MDFIYLAQLSLFGGKKIPIEWALCKGQLLSIEDHPELFKLIGTVNGGDGKTNFALPAIEAPIKGVNYIICINGEIPN